MSTSLWLVLVGVLALACSSQPPPRAPNTPSAKPAPKPQAQETPLHLALAAIQASGDVLAALSSQQRDKLDEYVASVTPEQRELLLAGEDPAIATRPLLYLAVGGQDLRFYDVLFSSNAASNELVVLATEAGDTSGLPELATELGRRAATHVLRARSADVSVHVEHLPDHLEQVAIAARFLGRTDIERLALEELARGEASGQWHLALARLAAERLDTDEASRSLESVAGVEPNKVESVKLKIEAARIAKTEASTIEGRVARARAHLTLGDSEAAAADLEAVTNEATSHLAIATLLLRARAGGSACPNVPPTLATPRLCQLAWAETFERQPLLTLEQAWSSGKGRDVLAVESFLGLSYVVPLMYGLTPRGEAADDQTIREAFASLQRAANEASALDREFSAIALLARALSVAIEAAGSTEGGRAVIPENEGAALYEGAKEMSVRDDTWGQATALGIAGILSQEMPARAIVDNLKGHVFPEFATTLGGLLLWDELADGDSQRFVDHKPLLGEIASAPNVDSFDRSKWLFTWAEAEAHLLPGERSYATLRSICDKLVDPRVPLDLQLRARLDLAGLDARSGKVDQAIERLHEIVVSTPRSSVSNHNEQELLIAATGYLFILRALATEGAERSEYVKKLEGLLLDVGRASAAPPTLQMWLVLWRAEFDKLDKLAACKGRKACEARVRKTNPIKVDRLGDALGSRPARLLSRGVVPVGGVQVEFSYEGRGRLRPLVQISPQFLLLHVPPSLMPSPNATKPR
jgi:hypothetical protein